jgi:HAD superfamily phosphatase (TIGR01681 family)
MKKKILFFDADGTLWYPKETKRSKHPVWVYRQYQGEEAQKQFVLIPGVVETLKKLKDYGVLLVVLSTNPQETEIAYKQMKKSVEFHGLNGLFDEVHATAAYPESKGEFILKILEKYGLKKEDALMVGDSYPWDYKSAGDVGVDAVLIASEYETNPVDNKITNFSELIGFLEKY